MSRVNYGKHTRATFSRGAEGHLSIFSLVHSDIWGPSRVNFTLGFRYFVSFIDDYSRCTWVFLMTCRFELFLYSRVSLLKYKISLVFLFILSVVIMP